MSFRSSFLRSPEMRILPSRHKTRKHQRRPRARQLLLERLEARWLLATYSWTNPSGGTWNSDPNWSGTGIPNAIGDQVSFGDLTGSDRTVTVGNNFYLVGTVSLAADNYTINASTGGRLTLDVSSGSAAINATGGTHTISAPLVLNDSLTVTNSSGNVLTLAGDIGASAPGLSFSTSGASPIILSGNNTYSGQTNINTSTLQVSGGNAISNTSAVVLANASAAQLVLAADEAVGVLSGGGASGGNVDLGSHTLTVGDGRNSTYAGVLSGTGGHLTKEGSGKLTLTGANTYTGATTVNAGTLLVNGSVTSDTTVTAGTLGGTGIVQGSVTVLGTPGYPGTLSPGINTGILTVNTLSLNDDSVYAVNIGGNTPGSYDQTTVTTGGVTIGPEATLNPSAFGGYTPQSGDHYVIINKTSAGAVSGKFKGFPEDAVIPDFLGSGLYARLTYAGGDGNDVVITVGWLPLVDIQLVALSAPSDSDAAAALPTSLTEIAAGDGFYLEVWVQDPSSNVGIAKGCTTITNTTAAAQALALHHGGVYTLDPSGTINDPEWRVENFGGRTSSSGQGISPNWVRLGYVQYTAVTGGEIVFESAPGTSPFSLVNGGNVDSYDIIFGTRTLTAIPELSIDSGSQAISQAEGNDDTTDFDFLVTLSHASNQVVTVEVGTQDGTAAADDDDYQAVWYVMVFLPGETEQTITVPVTGDLKVEDDETFSVLLSGPENAAIGVDRGTGTILNDDRDLVVQDATADGGASLQVTYEIGGAILPAFDIGFYLSADPVFDAGDTLVHTAAVSGEDELTIGSHTKAYTIGTGAGAIALPGAGLLETGDEYYILVVADPNDLLSEADVDPLNEDNTAALAGAYHLPGGDVYVHGTPGDDVIDITVPAGSLQIVSGADTLVYSVATTSGLRVRGHAGDDLASFAAGDGVVVTPALQLFVHGGEGSNLLSLAGSTGGDFLKLYPGAADMTGPGYRLISAGTAQIQAYATSGGVDTVWLYDSAGADTFTTDGQPNGARLQGPGFDNYAEDFDRTYAYATHGGNDTTRQYDSAGNDTFTTDGNANGARFQGTGFDFYAEGFKQTYAYATRGGDDKSRQYDSTGNDTFTADGRANGARFQGAGSDFYAEGFKQTYAYARRGGNDISRQYDSAANDTFTTDGNANGARFQGTGFDIYAEGFDQTYAYATRGGNDTAQLHDSAGNDTFRADGQANGARLQGTSFDFYGEGFKQTYAYASLGDDDTQLYDSAGDDQFLFNESGGRFQGAGFDAYAENFDRYFAYASRGGYDRSYLSDTAGDDMLVGRTNLHDLTTPSVSVHGESFDYVKAISSRGGTDTLDIASVDYLFVSEGPWLPVP
jgi:autotransporter-associated beta strand protein